MCPHCHEPLVILEWEGVELDHCLRCGGVWLDAGELEWMTQLAGTAPGKITALINAAKLGKKSFRRCPRCARKMKSAALATQPSIELDRCTWGHGIWLDRGELRAVLSAVDDDGELGLVTRFLSELNQFQLNQLSGG